MTPEQDRLLKNAFSLLDFDGDGKLGEDEFCTLLRSVFVYGLDMRLDCEQEHWDFDSDEATGKEAKLAVAFSKSLSGELTCYGGCRPAANGTRVACGISWSFCEGAGWCPWNCCDRCAR